MGKDSSSDYDIYGELPRQSLSDRIKSVFSNHPQASEAITTGLDYSKSDYDYGADDFSIPRKNHNFRIIAARVIMSGTVLASAGIAWMNRDHLSQAWNNLTSHVIATSPASEPAKVPATVTALPSNTPESTSTMVPPTPEPVTEVVRTDNQFGVEIGYGENNVPLYYQLAGQDPVAIDHQVIVDAQKLAVDSQLPQLIFSANLPVSETGDQDFISSPDRPLTTEKPADALTDEQLASHGITIIQGADTKLFLRPGAFEKGALLDTFLVGSENKITIVLVDGPSVAAVNMVDPKYDTVRAYAPQTDSDIEAFRQQQIDFYAQIEADAKSALKQDLINNSSFAFSTEMDIIIAQLRQEEYKQATISRLMAESGNSEYAGLYDPGHRIIFFAVGEDPEPSSNNQVIGYIGVNGRFTVFSSETMSGAPSFIPLPSQSHPRVDDFSLDLGAKPPMGYPYAAQSPPQVLRHELEHDVRVVAHPTGDYMQDRGEYYTDMAAMDTINQAFEKWKKSDYTDDSGYYFVFQNGDYYILGNDPSEALQ